MVSYHLLLSYYLQDFLDDIPRLHVRGDHECQSVWLIFLCWVTYFIDCLAHFHSRLHPFVSLRHPLHLLLQGHVQHHYLQLWAQLGPDIVPDLSVNEGSSYGPIATHPLPFPKDVHAHLFVAGLHDAEVSPLLLGQLGLNRLICSTPQFSPQLGSLSEKFPLVQRGNAGVLDVWMDVRVSCHEEAVAFVVNIAMVSTQHLCRGRLAQSRGSRDPKQPSLTLGFQLVVARWGMDGVAVVGNPLCLLCCDPLQVPYSHHCLDGENSSHPRTAPRAPPRPCRMCCT